MYLSKHGSIPIFIGKDKQHGSTLYQFLPHTKKYRKQLLQGKDTRRQIANRQIINCRDEEIEQRSRLGDFEGDIIIGKHHKGAVLTLIDCKSLNSMFSLLGKKKGV